MGTKYNYRVHMMQSLNDGTDFDSVDTSFYLGNRPNKNLISKDPKKNDIVAYDCSKSIIRLPANPHNPHNPQIIRSKL